MIAPPRATSNKPDCNHGRGDALGRPPGSGVVGIAGWPPRGQRGVTASRPEGLARLAYSYNRERVAPSGPPLPTGPEIIRRDLEPNPSIPDEPTLGDCRAQFKTPPAMYFEPAAFFMARSPIARMCH